MSNEKIKTEPFSQQELDLWQSFYPEPIQNHAKFGHILHHVRVEVENASPVALMFGLQAQVESESARFGVQKKQFCEIRILLLCATVVARGGSSSFV